MPDGTNTAEVQGGIGVRRRIAVGLDGSEPARQALRWAVREANRTGAGVLVVTAWPETSRALARETGSLVAARRSLQRMQQVRVAEAVAGLRPPPRVARLLVLADPVTALCHAARFADLVVVGSHDRIGLRPDSIAVSVARRVGQGRQGRRTDSAPPVIVATPQDVSNAPAALGAPNPRPGGPGLRQDGPRLPAVEA